MKKIIASIIGWLAMSGITYPALLARDQHIGWNDGYAKENCRQEMGIDMLFAMIPPVWIATPFLTGFYEHGLQFNCGKYKQ